MDDHIGSLKPDPRNARKHGLRNVGMIGRSLQETGFGRSVLVASDGTIIAGNATVDAAAEVGIETMLVVESDGTKVIAVKRTDVAPGSETAMKLALYDNRTAELAEWDADVLAVLNEDIDLSGLWSDDELAAVLASNAEPPAGLTDPDDVPEPPDEPVTRLGDVWQLGRHRLMCGDATDPLQIDRLLNDARPDMCLTDPPYGINAVTGKKGQWGGVAERYRPVANDGTADVAKDAFRLVSAMDIPVQIFWGANHYCSALPDSPCWIVWYKRDGADANDFADCELAWTNQPSPARLVHHVWNGFLKDSERGEDRVHPTQKPIFLAKWCLEEYGKAGDIVLDLFLGSGWALIACEQTDRTCYGMEIDPGYCDVVVQRWSNLTGQTAVRLTERAEAAD